MSTETEYPRVIAGRIRGETAKMIRVANERFGVTDGALVRMALEDYVPRYLAAAGQQVHMELFAKLGEALKIKPELAGAIEKQVRQALRKTEGRAA